MLFLRAQSDHGHVLPPLPLWLAWELCQPRHCPSPEPGLTGVPLNSLPPNGSVPALPTFRKTASLGHPGTSAPLLPSQHPGQMSRDPPGSGRLTPLFVLGWETLCNTAFLFMYTCFCRLPGSLEGTWPRVWPGRPGWPGCLPSGF